MDETAVEFILALRRFANNCNFSTTADTMIQDQILHGLRNPDLLRSFIQMRDAFTIQSALEHAREEEHVDHTLQQLPALQMPAGNRKLVHANKLRPYQSRVMSVGVMFEENGDFGEVECAPQPRAMRSEEVFPSRDMVAHLVERERGVIREVFERHVEQFGGGPTVAAVRPHEIRLQDGFVRTSPHPYRVPKSYRQRWGGR
ncbi:hypothetical protein MRX96_011333 [Rhipicephalus microplus]